jgi:hypothetical protein
MAWNVTEDADLGVRLARAGYRMGDLPSQTREEAPLTLRAWLKQRARWIKGYMQTLVTHSRAPLTVLREAGLPATFAFLSLGLGTVVTALAYPVFAIAAFLAWREGSLLAPTDVFGSVTSALAVGVWLFGAVALFLPPALGALRRGSPRLPAAAPAAAALLRAGLRRGLDGAARVSRAPFRLEQDGAWPGAASRAAAREWRAYR